MDYSTWPERTQGSLHPWPRCVHVKGDDLSLASSTTEQFCYLSLLRQQPGQGITALNYSKGTGGWIRRRTFYSYKGNSSPEQIAWWDLRLCWRDKHWDEATQAGGSNTSNLFHWGVKSSTFSTSLPSFAFLVRAHWKLLKMHHRTSHCHK